MSKAPVPSQRCLGSACDSIEACQNPKNFHLLTAAKLSCLCEFMRAAAQAEKMYTAHWGMAVRRIPPEGGGGRFCLPGQSFISHKCTLHGSLHSWKRKRRMAHLKFIAVQGCHANGSQSLLEDPGIWVVHIDLAQSEVCLLQTTFVPSHHVFPISSYLALY